MLKQFGFCSDIHKCAHRKKKIYRGGSCEPVGLARLTQRSWGTCCPPPPHPKLEPLDEARAGSEHCWVLCFVSLGSSFYSFTFLWKRVSFCHKLLIFINNLGHTQVRTTLPPWTPLPLGRGAFNSVEHELLLQRFYTLKVRAGSLVTHGLCGVLGP